MIKIVKRKKVDNHEFLPDALEIVESPISPLGSLVIWAIFAIILIAIVWSYLGKIDMVATARGQVIPNGNVKVVQPYEEGIITDILIEDGEYVCKDQLLVSLDTSLKDVDITAYTELLEKAELEKRTLVLMIEGMDIETIAQEFEGDEKIYILSYYQSFTDNYNQKVDLIENQYNQSNVELVMTTNEINQINTNISQVKDTINYYEELISNGIPEEKLLVSLESAYTLSEATYTDNETLYAEGIISEKELVESESAMIEAKTSYDYQVLLVNEKYLELNNQLQEAKSQLNIYENELAIKNSSLELLNLKSEEAEGNIDSYRFETIEGLYAELVEKEKEITGYETEIERVNTSIEQSMLRAPVDGIVYGLTFNTLGEVAKPAESIMTIVPNGTELIVEAKLLNKDIGYVEVGQEVVVKVDTYPFQKYKSLKGTVTSISPNAYQDDVMGYVYGMKIALDTSYLELNGEQFNILPGMEVTAEIKTGKRRVIDFFLEPLIKYLDESIKVR